MAISAKRLYGALQPGAAETTIYTNNQASLKTLVKQVIFANPTGAAVNVSMSVVPSGGTADGTHRVIPIKSVPANDSLVFDCFIVLHPGDFLSVLCSSTSTTVEASGLEGWA